MMKNETVNYLDENYTCSPKSRRQYRVTTGYFSDKSTHTHAVTVRTHVVTTPVRITSASDVALAHAQKFRERRRNLPRSSNIEVEITTPRRKNVTTGVQKNKGEKSKLPLAFSIGILSSLITTSMIILPYPFNIITSLAMGGPLSVSMLAYRR